MALTDAVPRAVGPSVQRPPSEQGGRWDKPENRAGRARLPLPGSCGPSSEVEILLSGLVLAVTTFQSVEDDRGQDGKCAEDEKGLVEAANHLA